MQRLGVLCCLLSLLLVACRDEPLDSEVPTASLPFVDGFETDAGELNELFPDDNSRWSALQLVHPANGAPNVLELSQDLASEGSTALRIVSQPADDVLSKADIEKGGLQLPVGARLTISADIYLRAAGSLEDLFLIDLECCSCWDPDVPDNQCPGVRLKLDGEAEQLSIERGKILGSTLRSEHVSFPRDRWVNVRWSMLLSPLEEEGRNELFLDGERVLDLSGKNMPNAEELRALFADNGVDFELQEPLVYERVQLGATANPTSTQVEVLLDNVQISLN